jgi:hypothetical protein
VLPDIALLADPLTGYTIYQGGKLIVNQIGGTSCSAPVMAGLLGLLNLKYSMPFCQYLYTVFSDAASRAKVFRAITVGSNDNLTNSQNVWSAAPGYNYLTGCGSFDGSALLAALQSAGLQSLGSPSAASDTSNPPPPTKKPSPPAPVRWPPPSRRTFLQTPPAAQQQQQQPAPQSQQEDSEATVSAPLAGKASEATDTTRRMKAIKRPKAASWWTSLFY